MKQNGGFELAPDPDGFFTSYARDGRFVSYYGDNHPRFAGNVVKAMASAKHGFPHVVELFAGDVERARRWQARRARRAWRALIAQLDDDLDRARRRRRPSDADDRRSDRQGAGGGAAFHPGQFYRLQNYESLAHECPGRHRPTVPLLMEGIALTGAWVDKEQGLAVAHRARARRVEPSCAYLKKGEPVVVMGPTGAPTEIPDNQNVLLLGGGLGNAVLFSIAKAMRDHGNRVIYFAGYKKGEDLFKREEIEAATDQVIWSTDIGASIAPGRPQDAHFRGNIVQAMLAYRRGELGTPLVPLDDGRSHHRDRVGSHDGGRESARHGVLAPHLKPDHVGDREHQLADAVHDEGSLRAVPAEARRSGDRARRRSSSRASTRIRSMDRVDFPNLAARLRQNTVQEKLSSLWLDHLIAGAALPHV